MLCEISLKLLIFNCSEKADKEDVDLARPGYGLQFKALLMVYFFIYRRVKTKTEKAKYAEKVRADSSVKWAFSNFFFSI